MIAKVIVDIVSSEVDRVFDYLIPEDFSVGVGDRVIVPFGNRTTTGYVIEINDTTHLDYSKLKRIYSKCDDTPLINSELISLMHYMTKKYHLRKIDVLSLFLPAGLRSGAVKELVKKVVTLVCDESEAMVKVSKRAKNQIAAIHYLNEKGVSFFSELSAKFGAQSINKLAELEVVKITEKQVFRSPDVAVAEKKNITLTDAQKNAIDTISNDSGVFVLHGVTGSGKTEIYMNVISNVLAQGKNAIMLVPEISLTPQVLASFKARFGDDVAILHSGLSTGERFDEWYKLLTNKAHIAVGARSAIFAPLSNLGVIVIDEEHDSSYISDNNPRYDTREVAEERARICNCPLVLGSATPSIETYHKAVEGKFKLITLPNRVNNKKLPEVAVVDMYGGLTRGEYGIFSNYFLSRLKKCVEEKKQAIVFINRRGFSSFIRCADCGYIPTCTDCDVSLVYHKEDEMLKCHYCDKRYKVLTKCPNCGGSTFRQGAVGTQKVCEELKKLFPDVEVFRMDNDTTKTKNSHYKILSQFGSTYPSILVGTQMIAKGHDFPLVTLVGIVDADISLYQADYRSSERCFELVTQVSGRAGRSEHTGEVVLQTYSPKKYVYKMAANYDYKGFYDKEIDLRKATKFPPFSAIARVLISGEDNSITLGVTKDIFVKIDEYRQEHKEDFIFCKAVTCPVKKIKTKFRYQILMRIEKDKEDEILENVYKIIDETNARKTQIFVELNPQNLG